MGELHMKPGQNIGEILLDIAQNAIRNGNPEKAISTYNLRQMDKIMLHETFSL